MKSEQNKKTTTNADKVTIEKVVSPEMTRQFADIYNKSIDPQYRQEQIIIKRREQDKKQIALDAGL